MLKKKIAVLATVTVMVMGACIGCGNNAKVENAVSANTETKAELVTYEFETHDNLKIVLDASNITAQEPSDDPEHSELISAEAANNIIAPGRDYIYLEDDKNYYVADLSRHLVTVADKSKVKTDSANTQADGNVTGENPWVSTDKDGILSATGLNINTPADATNAQYSYLKTSNVAQVTFSYAGHDDWTFRMQKTDKLEDISGLYYEWGYQESVMVSGKEAMSYAYAEGADDSGMIDDMFGVQLINWYDDSTGTTYSLSVLGNDLNGMDIQAIAENVFASSDK